MTNDRTLTAAITVMTVRLFSTAVDGTTHRFNVFPIRVHQLHRRNKPRHRVVETRETRGLNGSPVFTSDGRFLLLRFFDAAGTSSLVEIRDLLTGFRTSLAIQGRYFVRLAAANVTGTSAASSEVIVDVPSGQ